MGGGIPEAGAAIAGIMTKKLSRLVPQNACAEVKSRVVARLKAFYERQSPFARWGWNPAPRPV